MVAMVVMLASAGTASAAECSRGCENPPPVPEGASNANAFANAKPNAYDALLNNAAKHQGSKGGGCGACENPL